MLFIPTRNRPDQMADLIAGMRALGDVPETAVMIDGPAEPYAGIDWPANFRVHQTDEHLELQRAFNRLFALYPNEPCYTLSPDHSRPLSRGCYQILEAAAGNWNIAMCDDRRNRMNRFHGGRRFTAATALGGGLCRATGWVWPDFCVHLAGDDAWEELGSILGNIVWCEDAKVADLHFADGELKIDGNHQRLWRGEPYAQADWNGYLDWRETEMPQMVKVIEALRC